MKNDLPQPPYYAVIFGSQLSGIEPDKYAQMANHMEALAQQQPGYLGIESAKNEVGFGITISYWKDLESIKAWREQAEHLEAQRLGKECWYASYELKVARVEGIKAFGE
ncbi:MAG: antibiotic biosynthesis monooxygenase [Blastopirellula sp.]|nr:MAG: antibiotic biosynthesis monooxygenase [Blastopirellula sp.]